MIKGAVHSHFTAKLSDEQRRVRPPKTQLKLISQKCISGLQEYLVEDIAQ